MMRIQSNHAYTHISQNCVKYFAHKGREVRSLLVQIIVELKNDLAISGELHSVDQYLNVKLNNVRVLNENKYPHMVSLAWTPYLLQATNIVIPLAKNTGR